MELKQLEAFAGVAECKSFSLAAQKLYLTQPTVSAHIAALERELNVKLFERTTKTLRLTDEGAALLPIATRMLRLKSIMEQQAAADEAQTLTIGASSIPSTYLLPKVLCEYARCCPGTGIQLTTGNSSHIEELVADGAVELGVIGCVPDTPGLCSEYLCRDSLVLVTPVNEYYTGLRESGTDIAGLLKEPLILREDGSGTQQFVDRVLEYTAGEHTLNISVRSNSQETIKAMVRAGMGVSIMSRYAAAEMEERGLAYCYPIDIDEDRHFYIIYRQDRERKHEVRELIQLAHCIYT